MHPTIFTNKTIYPCLETVNEYFKAKSKFPISDIKSINERTNQLYNIQVDTVLNDPDKQVFEGIQG